MFDANKLMNQELGIRDLAASSAVLGREDCKNQYASNKKPEISGLEFKRNQSSRLDDFEA